MKYGSDDLAALRRRLIDAMTVEFGDDRRRIDHSLSVLGWAQQMLAREGGHGEVVIAAAILHDIGIVAAERKHGSSAAKWQELEGPPIARRILERLKAPPDVADHVCRIVGSHHSGGDVDTIEFCIVWDADKLVNCAAKLATLAPQEIEAFVQEKFLTESGRQLARQLVSTPTGARE